MNRGQSGFTLIELVCVMVIISAIAAFTAARMDSVDADGWAYRQAIASTARSARHIAQDSGCAVRFSVSADGDYAAHYRAGASDATCGTGAFTEPVPNGADGNLAGSAPSGAKAIEGNTATFDGNGALSKGSAGTIRVTGGDPIVIAASGYVHDG